MARLRKRGVSLILEPEKAKRITALVLLVALLLCHGLLGVAHQLAGPLDSTHHSVEGSSQAPVEDRGDYPDDHRLGYSDYVAALVSILFGAVIGLLLSGARTWDASAAPRLLRRYFPPLVFYSARGPTPPLTQVFRL